MASKSYSFRLPPELEAIVEERRRPGESSTQALQREVIAYLSSGIQAKNPVDSSLKKEVTDIIESHTSSLQKRLDVLEGKLSA